MPAPTTPRAKVSCPDPETPHAHYLDHIHENGPPSPLQAADSPWTKRLKSWYWKQQQVSGPVIDLSDDEVDALDEKPDIDPPRSAHSDPIEDDIDPPRSAQSDPIEDDSPVGMSSPPNDSSSAHPSAAPESSTRVYKWGTCPHCQCALHPAVPASGTLRGRFILRCNNFNRYDEGGRRLCWWRKEFHGDHSTLPRSIRRRRSILLGDLSFHFQG